MDVYATVMALAGVELPKHVDGIDLSPVLLRGEPGARSELAFYRKGVLRAFRKGHYKLHLYGQPQGGQPLENPELYDLRQDISERENIAASQPEVVADILAAIEIHRAQTPVKAPIFDARFMNIAAKK
jgi:arylsulfatase A-like enzyme